MPRKRIVVSLLSADHPFPRMQEADARRAAKTADLHPEVVFAEWNSILQIQQLFKFIHTTEENRPVAIVVETVTGEGLERVARNAARAGIGWILLNRHVAYLDALRDEHPGLPIATVGVDQQSIGHIQALQVKALLPKGGSVLCIQGPADTSAAQERLQALTGGLERHHFEMRVLNGDWTETSAGNALAAWMRLKTSEGARVDVVAAQNDAMAMGARNVMVAQRRDLEAVPFLGCDGLPDVGQRLVAMGDLAATVINPTTAGAAVELVARCLRDHSVARDVVLPPRSHPPVERLGPHLVPVRPAR